MICYGGTHVLAYEWQIVILIVIIFQLSCNFGPKGNGLFFKFSYGTHVLAHEW